MRAFLSHAGADGPIARHLKTCFAQVLGVQIFMMPDDSPPGSEWIEVVRHGISSCDELFSLVTPSSVNRPWISAEWACFWLQDKRCTPLMVDVGVQQLWEPMRAYQSVNLLDPTRSVPFLKRLADASGAQPAEGVLTLAHEIADEIPRIQRRLEQAASEVVIGRVSARIVTGTDNIDPADVAALVRSERLPELLEIALSADASAVKMRQVATGLVASRRLGEALEITRAIANRAEAKNVALFVIGSMDRGLTEAAEEWKFLFGVFDHLRTPQRRDVREAMLRRGIAPLGVWFDIPVTEP